MYPQIIYWIPPHPRFESNVQSHCKTAPSTTLFRNTGKGWFYIIKGISGDRQQGAKQILRIIKIYKSDSILSKNT